MGKPSPFVAKYTDLATLVDEALAQHAKSRLFGVEEPSGFRWLRYEDVAVRAGRFERLLAKLGVGRGDVVALVTANRPEWLAITHAAHRLGAIIVPMYEVQQESEWRYILADARAKVCFAPNDRVADTLRAMQLPTLEHVLGFDDDTGEGASGEEPPRAALAKDDLAILIYTSGTTGNPKGVELTHGALANAACSLHEAIPFEAGGRTVSILPWAHIGGVMELFVSVLGGTTIAIAGGVERIVPTIQHTKPTRMVGVPRVWSRIHDGIQKKMLEAPGPVRSLFNAGLRASIADREGRDISAIDRLSLSLAQRFVFPKVREAFGGELRTAISGAAALSVDVAKFLDAIGIEILELYGMTETCALATTNRPGKTRLGTVGQPLPGVEIRIDGHGEAGGEILVRTSSAMRGYRGLEGETRAVLDDGWVRTGDLGRLDPDDYLTITGRVREVYKLENGKFVAPAPIEEKLATSPYIAQAMIHGLNKPYNVALLVADVAAIRGWCEENGVRYDLRHAKVRSLLASEVSRLSSGFKAYERIERFHAVDEELSLANDMLTPTLKMKRRNVLAKWGRDLEALYE
ncbi:MAG TPA: long-chain fatty acid--CoA ligase [Labilithrix sp.]